MCACVCVCVCVCVCERARVKRRKRGGASSSLTFSKYSFYTNKHQNKYVDTRALVDSTEYLFPPPQTPTAQSCT